MKQPRFKGFRVEVATSNLDGAGTDADIYFLIAWRNAAEARGSSLRLPNQPGNDNEAGASVLYQFNAYLPIADLDQIVSLALVNGMNNNRPGWHVRRVEVDAVMDNNEAWNLVDTEIDRWLDTKAETGPAVVLPLKVPFTYLGVIDFVASVTLG